MYYVIYKSFRPYLSFFGDLYSKVLVICIKFYQSAQHYTCQLSHLVFFSSYICLSKKDVHGPYVFFVKLMFNRSMFEEFILTLKYRPKPFVGAFKVKYFIGLKFWHVNFHQIIHLHTCGICRVQIMSEGFQHLELAMLTWV
jgi:hypothetical protein